MVCPTMGRPILPIIIPTTDSKVPPSMVGRKAVIQLIITLSIFIHISSILRFLWIPTRICMMIPWGITSLI
jgi:hypothetical protein